jgi:uncharacterized RDD family membrane protein YckC
MSAPAGWYPDPQQSAPGAPPQQRYWDGQAWTEHVAPIAAPSYGQPSYDQPQQGQASSPETYGQPQQGQPSYPETYGQPQQGQPSYPQAYGQPYPQTGYAGGSAYGQPATTPDGAPLAGWWQRVGASVLDFLILVLLTAVLTLPLIRDVFSAFGDYFDASVTAAEEGLPAPSSTEFQGDVAGPFAVIAAVSLALNFVYNVGFLVWKQATPGKMALGLRVRLRERPELPVGTVLIRWATQSGAPGLLGLIPFVGALSGLFTLLDSLWPLWDDKKQAIHDKVARTNVVRAR